MSARFGQLIADDLLSRLKALIPRMKRLPHGTQQEASKPTHPQDLYLHHYESSHHPMDTLECFPNSRNGSGAGLATPQTCA
jgi:hypothetical protein